MRKLSSWDKLKSLQPDGVNLRYFKLRLIHSIGFIISENIRIRKYKSLGKELISFDLFLLLGLDWIVIDKIEK